MSKYQYKNPIDQGYKQFNLTKKQHNELFPYRKKTWLVKYEYYYNQYEILLHKFATIPAIILETLLFPVNVLICGLADIKDLIKDVKGLYRPKKYGSFVGDSVYKGSEAYEKIMQIIIKEI
jgi:hypothetical protein